MNELLHEVSPARGVPPEERRGILDEGVALSDSTVAVRPLRLLLLAACPFPAPQGSQVFVHHQAQALARAGHDVTLLTYPGGEGSLPEGIRHEMCAGFGVPARIRAGPWWGKGILNESLRRAARRIVSDQRPDIVHAHNIEALRIAHSIARGAEIPLIYVAHGLMELELPCYFQSGASRALARTLGRRLDRWAAGAADGFQVLDAAARDGLASHGAPMDRMLLAPPSFDLEAFDAVQPIVPGELKSAPGNPLIVYGGNLDGYQSLDRLRDAFAFVNRRLPEARLALVSHAASGARADVRRRWRGVRNVCFVEVRSFAEMKGALLEADILVSPRAAPGGFPVKLLNYMAAGKAIIACRPGSPWLQDGIEGLLVDGDSTAGLEDAIVRLSHDQPLRARLGRAARDRIRRGNGSGASSTVAALGELYRKCLMR